MPLILVDFFYFHSYFTKNFAKSLVWRPLFCEILDPPPLMITQHTHSIICVMVMAPLSAYLVSEPLGLTLGSQCTLETAKRDLLFKEILFGTKQQKQKSRQNW